MSTHSKNQRAPSLAGRLRRLVQYCTDYPPFSGLVLLLATVVALLWANTGILPSYKEFWSVDLGISLGGSTLSLSLHEWIDDALMVLFFFYVSLEVKYEFVRGALSSRANAMLPGAAALGGMLVPVAIYLSFNMPAGKLEGWAIPMATDVAFAIALLTLLGSRVPAGARAFLLALSVIDDVGTVSVIALFYSADIAVTPLLAAALGLLLVVAMRSFGVRRFLPYWLVGAAIWLALEKSGVHPTVGGVLLGLLTPLSMAGGKSERREQAATHLPHLLSQQSTSSHRLINELDSARNSALSPLELLQHRLEPWVLYFIMPVFALANAGVDFGAVTFTDSSSTWVVAGIALGLFLGKPLGIVLASWLAIRLTGARLPAGVTWPVLWGLGLLAGVGFTVALFITSLAFTDQSIATVARIGVLGGSVFSAVTGLALLGWTLPKRVKSASQAPKERPG